MEKGALNRNGFAVKGVRHRVRRSTSTTCTTQCLQMTNYAICRYRPLFPLPAIDDGMLKLHTCAYGVIPTRSIIYYFCKKIGMHDEELSTRLVGNG